MDCGAHRKVKLMEHAMKTVERERAGEQNMRTGCDR